METKKCTKCGEEKNFAEFNKHQNTKDRLRPLCKICECIRNKEYYKKNKEKMIEIRMEWKKNNREKQKIIDANVVKNLPDFYIKTFFKLKNVPKELIELKRVQLQITRELREKK